MCQIIGSVCVSDNMSHRKCAMNKKELIRKASATSGVPQQTLHNALEIIIETMSEELNNGNPVTFSNFGTFTVKNQDARLVRNPKNGVKSILEPRLKISFKTSPGIYRKSKK